MAMYFTSPEDAQQIAKELKLRFPDGMSRRQMQMAAIEIGFDYTLTEMDGTKREYEMAGRLNELIKDGKTTDLVEMSRNDWGRRDLGERACRPKDKQYTFRAIKRLRER